MSLFTDWQRQRINEVWLKIRMDRGMKFDAPAEFYGATRATKNLHPIADLGARTAPSKMGVPGAWYERLPHFRMGFTPSAGKELQSEYFVPREHAVDAIPSLDQRQWTRLSHYPFTGNPYDRRFWMIPDEYCYQRASVTIHFTWKPEWPAVSKLLPVIE